MLATLVLSIVPNKNSSHEIISTLYPTEDTGHEIRHHGEVDLSDSLAIETLKPLGHTTRLYVGSSYIDAVLVSLIYFPTSNMQLLWPIKMQRLRLIMEEKRKRQPLELMPVLNLPSGILDFRTFVRLQVTFPS